MGEFLKEWSGVIAIVFALIGGFLGLMEWKTRKDIRENLDKKLCKMLARELHDQDALKNLKRSVARESCAKTLRVQFIAADTTDAKKIEDVRAMFKSQKYHVSAKVKIIKQSADLACAIRGCNVVVFCVPTAENGSTRTEPDMMYGILSSLCSCEGSKTQCILYCPGFNFKINPDLEMDGRRVIDERYITTAQTHAKLRETLYMLLHFSPLNREEWDDDTFPKE